MATKTIKMTGTCKWARIFPENRDMVGYNDMFRECDGAYTMDFDPDEPSEQAFLESGMGKQRGRKSNMYKLVRKHTDPRFDWAGGPPEVYDADGERWYLDENGVVWNGSTVEVEVDVYDAGQMKGTRLKSVKVLELAEAPERDDA